MTPLNWVDRDVGDGDMITGVLKGCGTFLAPES